VHCNVLPEIPTAADVRFIEITILNPETSFPWIRVLPDDVHEYPVPKLIDNFLLGNTGNKLP
jgi:hypothetical protein